MSSAKEAQEQVHYYEQFHAGLDERRDELQRELDLIEPTREYAWQMLGMARKHPALADREPPDPELPYDKGGELPSKPADAPKRKRRTKAEMEADQKATEEAKPDEEGAPEPQEQAYQTSPVQPGPPPPNPLDDDVWKGFPGT